MGKRGKLIWACVNITTAYNSRSLVANQPLFGFWPFPPENGGYKA